MTSKGDRCLVQGRHFADHHNSKTFCQPMRVRLKHDFFNTINPKTVLRWICIYSANLAINDLHASAPTVEAHNSASLILGSSFARAR